MSCIFHLQALVSGRPRTGENLTNRAGVTGGSILINGATFPGKGAVRTFVMLLTGKVVLLWVARASPDLKKFRFFFPRFSIANEERSKIGGTG